MSVSIVEENVHHVRIPLVPDPDLILMRDTVRQFLSEKLPAPHADRASWTLVDPEGALWTRMAQEVGLQGLLIPEEFGGQGFGLSEASLLYGELGRALISAPLLSTMILGGRSLQKVGEAARSCLSGLAAGDLRATGVLNRQVTIRAQGSPPEFISGFLDNVLDGNEADILVLRVEVGDHHVLALVDLSEQGVSRYVQRAVDLTRNFTRLEFESVPVTVLATGAIVDEICVRTLEESTICLAAESVGVARWALESAVEYSKSRYQFGQPIGSFQALKHRMADMLISIEAAWSTVRYAAGLAHALDASNDDSIRDLQIATSTAKVASDRAVSFATAECIQIHGGIGFTWEHTAHLAFRRSASNLQMMGNSVFHRSRLVALQRRTP